MKPGVLAFYRIMAYVTAVLLILLCLTMVLKYAWPEGTQIQQLGDSWTTTIGIGHGYLYIVYLFIALVATVQLKAPLGRMLLVLLAGTIPLGAFFAERKVTLWHQLRSEGKPLPGENNSAPVEGTGSAKS
ncbi:integral membrane protein [Saccharopolyspora erythraea NRRL 2338]|uniref:Uncharacterized protein n=2 Tax=Saccharopolyspora erythraea TaxID=1836 RepID=A4F9A9_SACEN|nr:DUF3817 domain-containing protein [Saccharopolyspora erythraea]EQD86577.1 hypothetical protein N599_08935 [Saccharopolyspora erythraea D]PFG94422.1 integral membrane protein [Saccharopolyspora erythraea NRRL 2338]QRK91183.1 DUF3817 domain-containing protein [Saccharopolyspora erythraea]CAM00634.1 hypothetical protein SACE_1311 [Saccharopolyspora erythraea NRRL 2338]